MYGLAIALRVIVRCSIAGWVIVIIGDCILGDCTVGDSIVQLPFV